MASSGRKMPIVRRVASITIAMAITPNIRSIGVWSPGRCEEDVVEEDQQVEREAGGQAGEDPVAPGDVLVAAVVDLETASDSPAIDSSTAMKTPARQRRHRVGQRLQQAEAEHQVEDHQADRDDPLPRPGQPPLAREDEEAQAQHHRQVDGAVRDLVVQPEAGGVVVPARQAHRQHRDDAGRPGRPAGGSWTRGRTARSGDRLRPGVALMRAPVSGRRQPSARSSMDW